MAAEGMRATARSQKVEPGRADARDRILERRLRHRGGQHQFQK
jgi:hypothetical protein